MDDSNIILRKIEEKYERFSNYYTPMNSDFLSLQEQSRLKSFVNSHRGEGVFFWGGYPEAERKQILFFPDYEGIESEEDISRYWKVNQEECPVSILNVTLPKLGIGSLSHRDYLGALMGAGIQRAKIGDIIVNPKGAQIIATKEMSEYLKENLIKVANVEVACSIDCISQLNIEDTEIVHEKFTVSSPRIDNIITSGFGVSRKLAAEAIEKGKVFINDTEIFKPDTKLKGGEKVVFRGRGKLIYKGEFGTSRKGKIYIQVDKYK